LTVSAMRDAMEIKQPSHYIRGRQHVTQPHDYGFAARCANANGRCDLGTTTRMRRGASWFFTIAILSGINSLLQIFDAHIRFIFGLGITQVVGGMAKQSSNGTVVLLVVDGLFIGLLLLCGKWAREKSQGAFLGGMAAYALDGLLLVLFGMWIDAAVHAYALYRMWQGYAASRELAQLEQTAQPGLARVDTR
jgi:hypothetical protein